MKRIIAALLIPLLFAGCKTDFDLNDTWKETTVIYGLLNKSKDIQYVKVNKGFLGAGDANAFAQNPDSTNYDPAQVNITLIEKSNGNVVKTIILNDTILPGKKPGDFSTAKNIIYYTTEKLRSGHQYEINVNNTKTGNIAKSTTPIIDTLKNYSVNVIGGYLSLVNKNSTVNTKGEYRSPKVSWQSAANAKTYQLSVRLYYREKNITNPTLIENKYIDWLQPTLESANTTGGAVMSQNISGEGFYQFVGSAIAENPDVKRYADSLEISITIGSEALKEYIEINTPSSDLNQEKPIYTNIENGIGLFSTRYNGAMVRYLCSNFPPAPALPSISCTQIVESYQEFVEGRYTFRLGFDYP